MKRTLGVCYYPEHWPEAIRAQDAARMAQAGIRRVRIGEFAWSCIEPRPGELRFEWLDRAIGTLGAAGLGIVLGTPTAGAPPAGCSTGTRTCFRPVRRGRSARVRLPPPLLLQP